jgi:secondary thiamine-phosphate synthase enzyme
MEEGTMTEIEVRTQTRRQLVVITAEVQRVVRESGVDRGLCHVYVPHTTAAVVINENADPDVPRDLLAAYETLVPDISFAHAEGNSDAHFLSTVLGCSVTVPVEAGRARLGTWQGIFFVELDGPRTRRVCVTVAP